MNMNMRKSGSVVLRELRELTRIESRPEELAAIRVRAHLDTTTRNLLPRPARNERGEGQGRGVFNKVGLLSPALSSCGGGEGVDVLFLDGGSSKMRCASESLAALRVKVPPRLNMNDNTKT